MNEHNLLLAFVAAGKSTPSKRRRRAAILGSMGGDPIAAVMAGRSEKAAAERDTATSNVERATATIAQIAEAVDKQLTKDELVGQIKDAVDGFHAPTVADFENLSRSELDRLVRVAQIDQLEKQNQLISTLVTQAGQAAPATSAGATAKQAAGKKTTTRKRTTTQAAAG